MAKRKKDFGLGLKEFLEKTTKTINKIVKGEINMLEISIKDGKIYSYIRDKWLVCTPEEEVRQGFMVKNTKNN